MKKILICDDDEGILEATKILLNQSGYDVELISDGKDILKAIRDVRPDVVLLDLWMPNLDAKKLLKKIKKEPELVNVPIIIFSASNETEKISKEIGANDFIKKPFEIEDLTLVIEKNIN